MWCAALHCNVLCLACTTTLYRYVFYGGLHSRHGDVHPPGASPGSPPSTPCRPTTQETTLGTFPFPPPQVLFLFPFLFLVCLLLLLFPWFCIFSVSFSILLLHFDYFSCDVGIFYFADTYLSSSLPSGVMHPLRHCATLPTLAFFPAPLL
jgi:hypothetical protein